MANSSVNTTVNMETTSPCSSAGNRAYQDEVFKQQFGAVLAQINVDNIVLLAASVRQDMQARHISEDTDQPVSVDNPAIGCKVFSEPLRGSYNLAYRVRFDDGLDWILKVPANGSRARWDSLAADALTSEALTMKMIGRATTIPIPTIYSFDASLDNEIGCPYILMEFLKGRPLYEGWFASGTSSARLEQFRARALQTVAAAMVQLNDFTLHRGGALRFNSAGEPVDVVGAKVPDINAYDYDGGDENSYPEQDVWCKKGPTADPSDHLLFNLNRRGNQEGDSEYSRGVYESTRLFAKWALDFSRHILPQGQQFVLAHPDFDLQNILVLEDGTLAGILDWDGVAAVPLLVGCLKFPNWLIRDWDPYNYNWDVEAQAPKVRSGRLENIPEELVTYRAMYAQFIEMLLSSNSANDTARKMGAHITRLSLISLTIETAVNYPYSTGQTIGHLFRKMKQACREPENDDISETGAVASDTGSDEGPNPGPSVSDGERSDEDSLAHWDEAEGRNSDKDTTPTEVENSASDVSDDVERRLPERPSQVRIATLHGSSLRGVDKEMNERELSVQAAPGTTVHEPAEIELEALKTPLSDQVAAGETIHDQSAATSRKVGVVQWALDLGVKGCREACKAFKETTAVPLSPVVPGRAMPGAFIQTPIGTGTQQAKMHRNTDTLIPEKSDLDDGDDCQKSTPCEQRPHQSRRSESDEATEIGPGNVWAHIAADIEKGGIPIDWIMKRRDVIAQCVIENLGQEIEQEKEKELRLKKKKEARKTKRARQPIGKTDGIRQNIPSTVLKPSIESDKSTSTDEVVVERKPTLVEIFESCMAKKVDSTDQSNVSALAETESEVIQAEKPASAIEHHKDAESQTWKLNDPFYRAVDIANEYAMAMLLKLRGHDAAEILRVNLSPVAINVEEDFDGEIDSQGSPSTSISAVESSNLAAKPKTSVMRGRWFETPRGSLKRLHEKDIVSDSSRDLEQSSRSSKSSSEENGGSSKTSIATHGLGDRAGSSSGQLSSPETSQSQNINNFQVPSIGDGDADDYGDDDRDDDDDDDQDNEDGGVKLEDSTQDNNGEPSNESEDGELHEEDDGLVNEPAENTGREEQYNRGPMVTVDYGAFNMHEVCVALGRGNLDEARMKRLKNMFNILIGEVLGQI